MLKAQQGAPPHPSTAPYTCWQEEFLYRWKHLEYRQAFFLRLFVALVVFGCLFVINVFPGMHLFDIKYTPRIYDRLHELFSPVNDYFRASSLRQSCLILVGSLLMDVMVLSTWFYWMTIGDSVRFPLSCALFFILRAFVRTLCVLPFPPHFTWAIPTFNGVSIPSLVVQYQQADDFFYSGHIGCGILCLSEFFTYNCWPGMLLCCFVVIVELLVMLITRVHYTIDMLAGAIIASWIFIICCRLAPYVNNLLQLPPRPILSSLKSPQRLPDATILPS